MPEPRPPDITDEALGQLIIDRIIEGGLFHVDCDEPIVWSSNASAEVGRFALDEIEKARFRAWSGHD